jgi:hypothetical protein
MHNKAVSEVALAVGGILAGWEIDPEWTPQAGDRVTIGFDRGESPQAGQVPAKTTITLSAFHVLAAVGMRAGGRGLSQTVQTAARTAVGAFKPVA